MSALASVTAPQCRQESGWRGAGAGGSTYINLAILEALLQVVVDGLIGDFADQRKVRDTDLLLLGRLEDGLCRELGLLLSPAGGGGSGVLLAPCALGYGLLVALSAGCSGRARLSWACTMADARPAS